MIEMLPTPGGEGDTETVAEPGKDIYPSQWVLMPFWLLDKADTTLPPRQKQFYRELQLDALRQGTLELKLQTDVLKHLSGLDIEIMRNYLTTLFDKGLVVTWSYRRSRAFQWFITLSARHQFHWVLSPEDQTDIPALDAHGQQVASLFQKK